MTLMAQPTSFSTAFDHLDQASPVHDLRKNALEQFDALGFPTRRDEDWRFTNVKPIASTTFARADDVNATVAAEQLGALALPGSDAHALVFVNGRFAPDLSAAAGTLGGARVLPLHRALADDFAAIEPFFGNRAGFEHDAFTALNTAFLEEGAFIHVPRATRVDRPIVLLFVTVPGPEPIAVHPRVLIVAEDGADVTVVERYAALGEGTYFTNPVTEIFAGASARVDHHKIVTEGDDASHVSALWTHQDRDTHVTSHNFTFGGRLVRHNVRAALAGEHTNAVFNGLYVTRGREHVDNHLRVEHREPHGDSREYYKGILRDDSSSVFTGRIFVCEDAQKTDAKQTNANLLLSDSARVVTKPQLEIFADDVKCTHGATIGQLEPSQLFYLRARGIDAESARRMIIRAFAGETIAEVAIEELREQLEAILIDRLSEGQLLASTT